MLQEGKTARRNIIYSKDFDAWEKLLFRIEFEPTGASGPAIRG